MTGFQQHLVRVLGGESRGFADPGDAIQYALGKIREFARAGASDPTIYKLSRSIVRGCHEMDKVCYARSIHDWMRENVKYVPDPPDADEVAEAVDTLDAGGGDCDDMATVFGALARSVSLPVVYLLGSARPGVTLPTHILAAVRINGQLLPVELSAPLPFGTFPPGFRIMQEVAL